MSLSATLHSQIKAANRERLAAFTMRYFGKDADDIERLTTDQMRKDVMNFFIYDNKSNIEKDYTF